MARFCGKVGYVEQQETSPSVWEEVPKEIEYRGDILQNNRRWENGEGLNDDININNRISIVADAYAFEHFFAIRYVKWMGAAWKVTNVEIQRPRLILSIGGIYNGETVGS